MIRAAERPAELVIRQMIADLAPFAGRAETTWRIALVTALVAAVAMMFENPEAAVSCYLVTLIMKPDGTQNCASAIALTLLITVIIAVLVLLSRWTIDSTPLRLAVMATTSFALLFIGAASKLGEAGGVIALIIAVVLSLVYKAPGGDIVTTALRYAWEMVVMPMGVMAAFSLFFGRSVVSLLRDTLGQRLAAAHDAILSTDPAAGEKLRELLREGNAGASKRAALVRRLHLAPAAAARQIESDAAASYQLMLAVSGLPPAMSEASRAQLATEIKAAIEALDAGRAMPVPQAPKADAGRGEQGIRQALATMAGTERPRFVPSAKEPFLAPDAFSNPAYQRFALKTTAAAMLCYIFYAGLDWQGIHTAMITCYVASLGTTGESIHKLALRITGCLIGAVMGWGSILFLMPYMDSVGHLMLLIFAGTLVAAWVSTGSERISYAGIQIGLAFFLCILHGFGPSLDMVTTRDRIIGILVGNVAVHLISTHIWPVSTDHTLRTNLSKALAGLARLAASPAQVRGSQLPQAADVEQAIGRSSDALYLLLLESRRLRPSTTTERNLRLISDDVESLNAQIYLSADDLSRLSNRLAALSGRILLPDTCAKPPRPLAATGPEAAGQQESGDQIETRLRHVEALVEG